MKKNLTVKQLQKMAMVLSLCLLAVCFTGCAVKAEAQTPPLGPDVPAAPGVKAAVYMTTDISPAGLMAVYLAPGPFHDAKLRIKGRTVK